MVQPIMSSLGRSAKVLSTGNKVISETFKDGNNVRVIMTRVLNKDNKVLSTRMKYFFEKVLKNGKKILARMEENHIQEKVAGTAIPKQGKEYMHKSFMNREVMYSNNGEKLFTKELRYKKLYNNDLYTDKTKILQAKNISSITNYAPSKNVEKSIRLARTYSGADVEKLQHVKLFYEEKGLPKQKNNFDLSEFEIFNNIYKESL